MILKLLLVIGVIAIVYFMFMKKKSVPKPTEKKKSSLKANDMVECVECGVYVEINEAILSNGKYYCSQECLKKG